MLTWLGRFKNTRDKLNRWSALLSEFRFEVKHIPGPYNELPDMLSSLPQEGTLEELDDIERMMPPDLNLTADHDKPPAVYIAQAESLIDEIRSAQQIDSKISEIAKNCIQLPEKSSLTPEEDRFLQRYVVKNGTLWQRRNERDTWKMAVPRDAKKRVLFEFYDS